MSDADDRRLEERLHRLAHGVPVPVVAPEADVQRGRRRLLRLRLAVAGGTAGTLAVVAGAAAVSAGYPTAEPQIHPSTQLPSPLPAPSPTSEEPSPSEARAEAKPDSPAGGPGTPAQDPAQDPGTGTSRGGSADSKPTEPVSEESPTDAPTTDPSPPEPSASPTPGPTDLPTPSTSPTPTSTATPTEAPTATPTATPTAAPTSPPTSPPPSDPTRVRIHATLRTYNDVIAEHVDPERDHLVPYTRRTGNRQTSVEDDRLFALGSRYAWFNGRESGVGMLQVYVASGWDQVEWECGASGTAWDCHSSGVADATSAEVAVHDGLRQVAVEHPDGQVVVLTADPTYDNDEDGVSRLAVSETQLLEAAADERLTLPGVPPQAPPRIDAAAFEAAGLAALARSGETLEAVARDRSPMVAGELWVDGEVRGLLTWSAAPVYSGTGWECSRRYRECTEVDVNGQTVHVASVKKRWGGGFEVAYDGPSYLVRVHAAFRGYPKKRAFGFVTDGAWQPTR